MHEQIAVSKYSIEVAIKTLKTDIAKYYYTWGKARNWDYIIEFTNNPNDIIISGTLVVNVAETNNGNTSNFTYNVNGDFDEGFHTDEWRIENGNLITRSFEVDPNEEGAFDLITEIIELTSNSLILRIDNAQYSSENSTRTGIRTLTYTKQ